MNITIQRSPGDKAGPDIIDSLLTSEAAAIFRGTSDINYNDSSRKILNGNGPKNTVMLPAKLIETIKKSTRYRGILTMYSRSYNKSDGMYKIDSSITAEIRI